MRDVRVTRGAALERREPRSHDSHDDSPHVLSGGGYKESDQREEDSHFAAQARGAGEDRIEADDAPRTRAREERAEKGAASDEEAVRTLAATPHDHDVVGAGDVAGVWFRT